MEYLNDQVFLNILDRIPIRKQHLRLTLLDFQERAIREIAGVASGNGTLNLNGASATRRTISFNMIAEEDTNNLTNIDNLISINKKFNISVGIENPLVEYKHYGDIVWFPLGLYVISKASLSWSTSSCSISIQGKDKMCMLDGSVGGTLPTTVVFHELYQETDDGSYIIEHPTIRRIIFEAVHHYGGEAVENIIISDLDDKVKKLVRYVGDVPMWLQSDDTKQDKNIIITNDTPSGSWKQYSYDDDVGYTQTEFSYPGELILSAGETVVALLNKIVSVLGNYEFFYNLEGKFVFQRIPTYQDVAFSQITIDKTTDDSYIRSFNNSKYAYSLTDMETVVSINSNPNYDNIKNDFIVWGQRPLTGDAVKAICYRLAIDDKPELNLCKKYMFKAVINDVVYYRYENDFIWNKENNISLRKNEKDETVYYAYKMDTLDKEGPEYEFELIAGPGEEWREELYRAALEAAAAGTTASRYDTELLEFWRQNYNPSPIVNKNTISFPENNWNTNVLNNPKEVNYWLDFIDTSSSLGKYSINNIGCRSKVTNNDKIRTLVNPEVPDVIYVENPGELEQIQTIIKEFNAEAQKYCFLTSEQYEKLITSATGSSAYDIIREMLYQNLNYNTQVTITSIPKYYLEPNNLIYIRDIKSNIIGDYVIKTISIPLGYNGTMSITANEALTRV